MECRDKESMLGMLLETWIWDIWLFKKWLVWVVVMWCLVTKHFSFAGF
jgi:hypothetical protein